MTVVHPVPPTEDESLRTTGPNPALPDAGSPTPNSTALLPGRPVLMAGGRAALAAAGGGLAVLVTLALIGWITAPHVGLGGGLVNTLRSAGLLWLVAHHVALTVPRVGRIGLLPLGLVLLPAALLERAGRWLTHEGHVVRLIHVFPAALSVALPYALFAGAVALASSTSLAAPSLWQAVLMGFLIALLASGFGAARGLAPWRRLTARVPRRPRSVLLGLAAALAALTACGAILVAASLLVHLDAYRLAVDKLNPGLVGSVLLLLASVCYLPNAVIWAVAYLLGPGFALGVGTAVSPAGSALGAVPAFPELAALPTSVHAAFPAWLGFFILALPYLAGALAGLVTVRIAPTPAFEAAPLWGLLTGALTAVVIGLAAHFSGGALGAGRLSSVGPNSGETGLVALLEVGVTAALSAGLANWLIIRRHIRRLAAARAPEEHAPVPRGTGPQPALIVDESDDAGGHRIHVNPWADEDWPEEAGPPGDRQ
jgi:hypothetical protein